MVSLNNNEGIIVISKVEYDELILSKESIKKEVEDLKDIIRKDSKFIIVPDYMLGLSSIYYKFIGQKPTCMLPEEFIKWATLQLQPALETIRDFYERERLPWYKRILKIKFPRPLYCSSSFKKVFA